MRFEHQGIALWFGTPDAPSPGEMVAAGTEVTITVGVQPADASNKVELLCRINQGQLKRIDAEWLRSIHATKSQYFQAKFPVLSGGEQVEYASAVAPDVRFLRLRKPSSFLPPSA